MKPVALSKRLQAVAAMVTAGNRVCDVGCDHGFVSVWLVEQGISPSVLAMDVRSGPLSAAKGHIAERGLEKQIGTRLSDGLHNYNIGEADTLICAGMGGALMRRILSQDRDKADSFKELILQPQSEVEQFRGWLKGHGYRITQENMIEEDGKFYPMMRVEIGDGKNKAEDNAVLCKLENRYGALLLASRNRTLEAYLRREERIYMEILENLRAQGLPEGKRRSRYTEISELLEECRMALKLVVDRQ